MNLLICLKQILEYLGGVSEEPPRGFAAVARRPIWWGLWWTVLIGAIIIFCGQTSKFIYIDF